MYKAFSLSIDNPTKLFPTFECSFDGEIKQVVEKLPRALKSLQSLDASVIQSKWFESVDSDVFISHSSKDSEAAKRFGAYLKKTFGLKVFIDSLFWQHMDDLLRALDNEHCVSEKYDNGAVKTYSYDRRNITSAHVHMILSHALTQMINHAECFIYLDTKNATSAKTNLDIKTHSPWLFHELAMVNVIQENRPKRLRLMKEGCFSTYAEDSMEDLEISYSAPRSRLVEIRLETIQEWADSCCDNYFGAVNLDKLYELVDAYA